MLFLLLVTILLNKIKMNVHSFLQKKFQNVLPFKFEMKFITMQKPAAIGITCYGGKLAVKHVSRYLSCLAALLPLDMNA